VVNARGRKSHIGSRPFVLSSFSSEESFPWQVVVLAVQPTVGSVLVIVQVWRVVQASRSELLNKVLFISS
jgi:hypothetical protein